MVLQHSNHQQPAKRYELNTSQSVFTCIILAANNYSIITNHHSQYFTATILEWKHLLKPDKYKDVITDSLKFMAKEKWIEVNGFCIMSNHIHLIWQIQSGFERDAIQRNF